MRKLLKRLGLIALGIVVATLAAEFTLAIFFPQQTASRIRSQWPAIYQPSATMPYELIPNVRSDLIDPYGEFATTVSINSLGYRNREFSKTKAKGVVRVLAIGDSFTFGWGVEGDQAYPSQLERALRTKLQTDRFEVINAGFAACFSPDTYYLYLMNRGLALKPDVVVVGFYIGNDIDEYATNYWKTWRERVRGFPSAVDLLGQKIEDGYLVAETPLKRYATPVLRNSHLAQAIYSRFGRKFRSPDRSFNHLVFRKEYARRTVLHFGVVKSLLREMHRIAGERGIPLVVMVIPAREQVHPLDDDEFRRLAPDLNRPNGELRELFTRKRIRYVDLLGPLRRASKTRRYYFTFDNHWNVDGHRFAGDALADALEPIVRPRLTE